MTRIKTPNQKKLYDSLDKRLDGYENTTGTLLNNYNERVAVLVAASQASVTDKMSFTFNSSDNKEQLNNIIKEAKTAIYGQILGNTKKEWTKSNEAQDNLIDTSIKRYVGEEQAEEYYQDNEDELKRFQERTDDGLTVYGRVDNHTKEYKSCLEAAISMALLTGATLGAAFLLSRIKHYLSHFSELQEKYTKQYGEKKYLKDAAYYLKRLVRSEANMAYRQAELVRWNQWSFILGYKICLSPGHKEVDICDELKGNYPKTFIWTGWHPNDRCFCVPILQTKESLSKGGTQTAISDVPQQFIQYVANQHDKIIASAQKGTLAYFLRDNKDFWISQFSEVERSTALSKVKRTYSFVDRVNTKISEIKFNSYNEDIWTKAVFYNKNGGYYVIHTEHKFSKVKGKGATFSGGQTEKEVANILAKRGKRIEILPELSKFGEKSADMKFDGKKWDVKNITTANTGTIRGYFKDTRKADCVIFYDERVNCYKKAKSAIDRELGNYKNNPEKLKEFPTAYVFHSDGTLIKIKTGD